jgi:L-asparaginase II
MLASPAHAPLIATTRGGAVECVHYGSIAVVDRSGRLMAGTGAPDSLNFTRSALKPLQALPFVEDGGLARFGFGSHELALMCASHSGEAVHLGVVQRILERIDAGVGDLQCGWHPPQFYAATNTQYPPGSRFSALHHNCSGKHSGFLAYCRLHGHRLGDYLDREAPLQVRIRNTVQAFAGADAIAGGIDGCSAPNYAMPLARLAQTYARIASGETPELRAVAFAMTRHPDLVSGTARTDLALMQAGRGDWVCKIGADGIQAIGVRSHGLGVALRIADGNPRALHAATVEVLHQLGLLADPTAGALAPLFRPVLRNARGTGVGRVEPLFTLPRLIA